MVTPAPVPQPVPLGPPGPWTLDFEDLFDGTALDPANWTAVQGASNSNVITQASAVSVSGGYCRLLLGGMICSNPVSGFPGPVTGPALAVGDCVEFRISFPGPSGSTSFNWPAAWCSGPGWPEGGEQDWAEGYNGRLSALNYHSPAGASNGPFPPGDWCNAFHVFTGVRGETDLSVYWDGQLMRAVPRTDDGSPQSVLVLVGAGNTASDTAEILVDYVRMWSPGVNVPPVAVIPMNDAIRVNAGSLPRGVQAAGYSTGSGVVPWGAAEWAAHPGAVRIDQSPVNTALDEEADVLDVEGGAATAADVPGWAEAAAANFASGKRPGQRTPAVYVNLSNATAVVNALVAAKILGGVSLWLANWNLTEAQAAAVVAIASGPWPVIAVQYSNQGGGGSYDTSAASTAWLANVSGGGAVTPPAPVPVTAPPPFPWPAGNYIGLESADPACHSGYTPADRPHVAAWQEQMSRRGWVITADGGYGAASAAVAVLFQRQVHLTADGLVGPATWMASFVSPVT